MSLDKYKEKRRFERTPEPTPAATEPQAAPAVAPGSAERAGVARSGVEAPRFCVQRHSARRLHYDLRLELDGVLKSWAVPKGPTLDPGEKRLAVLVEDHPLEYGDFEGTIPEGNYGAGSVILWDKGTYEWLTTASPQQMWEAGDLKFRLHGEKLMGEFALVRTKRGKGNEWLLIKKRDFAARPGWDAEHDLRSVASTAIDPALIAGAVKAPMPSKITPMMACLGNAAPQGPDWVYEIKWDGFRSICFVGPPQDSRSLEPGSGRVRLRSRNNNSFDALFPELQALPEYLQADTAILDGEVVCVDAQGRPSFELIQGRTGMNGGEAVREGREAPVVLFAFDLLYLNGYDLRQVPLVERKRVLHSILKPSALVRYSEHFTGNPKELLGAAKQNGLEGIMAKRGSSLYESRRSPSWLKIKNVNQQEFVICGWLEGERSGFGSVVLGYYDGRELKWAGNAGTGFSQRGVAEILARLKPLETPKAPFKEIAAEIRSAHWVRPELVCTVKFQTWTRDGRLRAPVFLGLRGDIEAADCVRENGAETVSASDSQGSNSQTRRATSPRLADSRQPTAESSRASRPRPHEPLLAGTQAEIVLDVDGRRLKFTNLNKVFYPREGYKKRDIINYYDAVAPLLVPHLEGRPLSLKRYPNGIEGKFFFQKDAHPSFPNWLRIEPIHSEERGEPINFVVCDDRATLLFLANLGCIDQNPWMSRVAAPSRLGTLENPDFVLIDLDPVECAYDRIVEAAQLVRRKLDAIGLEGYPKTTGGDGMHVYIPLAPRYTYEQTRTFAEILARLCSHERPDLFTTPRSVEKRTKGKVYFDYLQNREGSTISAPYVLRAYPGAPVSTPLRWEEVVKGLTPAQFHLGNAVARFERVGDLFEPVLKKQQRLEPALEKLGGMVHGT